LWQGQKNLGNSSIGVSDVYAVLHCLDQELKVRTRRQAEYIYLVKSSSAGAIFETDQSHRIRDLSTVIATDRLFRY